MQPSQHEESKANYERPEQLKLHNRLNNKKDESSEEISPKKEDDGFFVGSDNDDIDDSDAFESSPQVVNK